MSCVSDVISTIKNGYRAKKSFVFCPSSSFRVKVLKTLKEEGFLEDIIEEESIKGFMVCKVFLRYRDSMPAIDDIKLISKPGRRVYVKSSSVPFINGGLGDVLLSTSRGVMTGYKARSLKLGGELIMEIF